MLKIFLSCMSEKNRIMLQEFQKIGKKNHNHKTHFSATWCSTCISNTPTQSWALWKQQEWVLKVAADSQETEKCIASQSHPLFFPKHVQSAEALKNSSASLLKHEIKCCQSPAESAAVELQAGLADMRPSEPEPRRAEGRSLSTLTVVSISDIFRSTSRVQDWPDYSGLPWQHADTLVWMLGYLRGCKDKNHQPGEAKWTEHWGSEL